MIKGDIKAWIQHRIDYWETVSESRLNGPFLGTTFSSYNVISAFENGFNEGEEKGILEGLYQVMEYIDGERR